MWLNYAINAQYEYALKHELRTLTQKKQFELDLAYKDVENQPAQERLVAQSQGAGQDSINTYANEAGDFYSKALRKIVKSYWKYWLIKNSRSV